MSADRIITDYEKNELAADQRYQGTVIQVTGYVDKVDTELFESTKYVLRVGAEEEGNFTTVDCRVR